MNKHTIGLLVFLGTMAAVALMISSWQLLSSKRQALPANTIEVLELYTSQGCSSCPPADRLLTEYISHAPERSMLALSFHVDYWNRLGWVDPYSSSASTDRQYTYAEMLDTQVYTPMMVVNGKKAVIGSRKKDVEEALTSTDAIPELSDVLSVNRAGEKLEAKWQVDPSTHEAAIRLLLVQQKTGNRVNRGENNGKQLLHHHVVREMRVTHEFKGTLQFSPPGQGIYFVALFLEKKGHLEGVAWSGEISVL